MKLDFKHPFTIIGMVMLFHWVLFFIDRVTHDIFSNIYWVSHLVLLLAGIAFLTRSNLLLSGALISVLIGHGVWIYDVAGIASGISNLQYAAYFYELSLYRKLLTIHHVYLIPTLSYALWKQGEFHKNAWLVASGIFAFSSLISFFFVTGENVMCMHELCPFLIDMLPFIEPLTALKPFTYLIVANLVVDAFGFLVPNMLILLAVSIYRKRKKPI